jgi:Predicted kinase
MNTIIVIDSSSSSEEDDTINHDNDNDEGDDDDVTSFVTFTKDHHQNHPHPHRDQQQQEKHDEEWNVVPSRQKRKDTKFEKYGDFTFTSSCSISSSSSSTPSSSSSFMIVLMGIPGSGKSHLANRLVSIYPKLFIRISQDVLKSKHNCIITCKQAILSGKVPIIDRCNINPQQRQSFLSIASEYNIPVDGILFQYSQEECTVRCEERPFHETLDKSNARRVVAYMAKDFNPPKEQTDGGMFRSMKHVSSFHQANAVIAHYTTKCM